MRHNCFHSAACQSTTCLRSHMTRLLLSIFSLFLFVSVVVAAQPTKSNGIRLLENVPWKRVTKERGQHSAAASRDAEWRWNWQEMKWKRPSSSSVLLPKVLARCPTNIITPSRCTMTNCPNLSHRIRTRKATQRGRIRIKHNLYFITIVWLSIVIYFASGRYWWYTF